MSMKISEFEFKVKTINNSAPIGKPKVYFTCHPDDFNRCFNEICTDIFTSHDCAIYYTEDLTMSIQDECEKIDLERMNLFVIPVSYKLLSQSSRAMNIDFPFAKEKHIPVLPIMIDSDIDELYGQADKFGEIQYLNRYSIDASEISYKDKLKKYLDSVLVSEELFRRIRDAFDAHIFLSYRKKDRKLANDLMKFIHSHSRCRDIAIWYDEYLTPGKSFKENIYHNLNNSNLFALLVTPNLLEEPDGKPNFVMKEEYPAAKNCGKTIFPVEMRETIENGGTDKGTLFKKFEGLPECVDTDDEMLIQRILDTVISDAKKEYENDPIHNYLLGLAYLDGIDVEINREYARMLFEDAHSLGFAAATKQLSKMYSCGNGVEYNIYKAAEYEQFVLSKEREVYKNTGDKKRFIEELVYMAELCLMGKKEKTEPSPYKLFDMRTATNLYIEAVKLQEDVINTSKFDENNYRFLRNCLSKLCTLLSGWDAQTQMSCEKVITYFRKWSKYAAILAEISKYNEDVFQWRESNYMLLQKIGYDSDDYETILNTCTKAAKTAIECNCGNADFWREEERAEWISKKLNELQDENNDNIETLIEKASLMADRVYLDMNFGIWRDYDRLFDILYYNGVKYYSYMKQYNKVNEWLHRCYIVLDEFSVIIKQNEYEKDVADCKDVYNFRLHLVCSGSVNAIYDLIVKNASVDNAKAIAQEIFQDLINHYDKNDVAMCSLIPGLKTLI